MNLVCLILIHKNIAQANELIDKIADDKIAVYVHIDKKSKIDPTELNPKAKLIQNRISILWGDYSQVQATLNSIEEIDKLEHNYSHICFISGQDYPIKSNEDIIKCIEKGKDYLEYCEIYKQNKWKIQYRFEGWYYTKKFHILRILSFYLTRFHQKYMNIKRKPLPNIIAFGGSSWWTLSSDSIKFILDFVSDKKNKRFIKFFKWMCCCDEHFFHCILCNSDRINNIVNDNLRYILWKPNKSNPEILTIDDYENIVQSNKLFCRKIEFPQSKELIDKLSI